MAIAALTKYIDTCREHGVVPKVTYGQRQNYDLLRASASMEGRKEISISAARDLIGNLPATSLKQDPLAMVYPGTLFCECTLWVVG